MKNFKILFIKISFLGLAFQGCGGGAKTKKNYPTAIGSAVSLTAQEERANNLGLEVSKIIETRINTINQQEATSFSKTTRYCDVSGLQEKELFGTMDKITQTSNYQSCENDTNVQHGDTVMTYKHTDEDGKFPDTLELQAKNDYQFNNITLKEGATIECQNIIYAENNQIKSMILIINGTVEYDSKTYTLENHTEIINF